MAEVKSWKCDECGVQKMESNHWVLAFVKVRDLLMIPWQEDLATSSQSTPPLHLCGEGCAAKIMSRQIQAWRAQ